MNTKRLLSFVAALSFFSAVSANATVQYDADGNTPDSISTDISVRDQQEDSLDMRCRNFILDWIEGFRMAIDKRDVKSLEAVYSSDALIVTEHGMLRRSDTNMVLPDKQLAECCKGLMVMLKRVNSPIEASIEEINVVRHPKPEHNMFYGVSFHLSYTSGAYYESGYMLMLWDFTNEDKPIIHVRTWKPDTYFTDKDVSGIVAEDIISILELID